MPSYLLSDPDRLEATVRRAFHLARTGRPGPVLVDLPRDVTSAPTRRPFSYPREVRIPAYRERRPLVRRIGRDGGRGDCQCAASSDLLRRRRGPGRSLASEAQGALAELTGAPVTSTSMGLGAFSGRSPQFIGMHGLHGLHEANLAMQNCDVLIAVGARFDDRVIGDTVDFARPRYHG